MARVQRRVTTSASEPREIARSVQALRRLLELPEIDPLEQISASWESIVGAPLAPFCSAELVRNGALVIVVDQAAIAEQLRWRSAGVVEGVNAAVGQVLIDRITVRNRPY